MKRLTLNQVARANLRVNRKAYVSLFLGILLAVYLATATSLCAWGTVRGHEEQMARRVGWMDMFLLSGESATDEQLRRCGFFREIGHVTVTSVAEGTNLCAGYYDETAAKLMNRTLLSGRMPEKAGEVAAEQSALIRLGYENAEAGETLTLSMEPIYGIAEEKTFTLVGILSDQTDTLDTWHDEPGMRFPALLVSPEETWEVGSALVHRVLTYAPAITLNQVERNCPVPLNEPIGVSREYGTVTYWDSGWERASKLISRILIWAVLGAALMLSACVGITSAMENLLSRKTEDIGMLRAIGATRRQIRRVYGAEAWLLAATALPAGLAAGILTAWIISRIAPDQIAFSLNAWLLIPILGLSLLCVFTASRLPLYHASRQMPMGVLRDTALLRKAGKLRSRTQFRPDRLIAGRRTRLHPLRQAGTAGMIALTLFSTLMLGELVLGYRQRNEDTPAFQLYGAGMAVSDDPFSQIIPEDAMSPADLRRIAAVPGVSEVRSVTEMTVNLLLDEVPEYFRSGFSGETGPDGSTVLRNIGVLTELWAGSDWLFYTDEDLADARARRDENDILDMYVRAVEQRDEIRAQLGLTESVVPVCLYVADLDAEALQRNVTDGSIDPEKLDSGEQALVYAPVVAVKKETESGYRIERWLMPDQIREHEWDIVISNDAFSAGMPLKLLELAGQPEEESYGEYIGAAYPMEESPAGYRAQTREAVRADVTVGAVLSGDVEISGCWMTGFSVILTRKGAEALGLKMPAPSCTNVYLSGNLTAEEEKEAESRISQIALNSWTSVENRLQQSREYRAKKTKQMLLFAGLILLFFAVSVFMQVSGAARQIRAETRTIGTLRAVGADLKTLVGCYRLPVWVSAAAALVPCALFYGLTELPGLRLFSVNHPVIMLPVLALLAGCVALACIAGIRNRLAGVTRRSIVENIREL